MPVYPDAPTLGALLVIFPPKVRVEPVTAAIVPPYPLIEIALEIVPVVFPNKVPRAPTVTVPVDRCVPLEPPVATDKIPALTVVPALYVFAPDKVSVPEPDLVTAFAPEMTCPTVIFPRPVNVTDPFHAA